MGSPCPTSKGLEGQLPELGDRRHRGRHVVGELRAGRRDRPGIRPEGVSGDDDAADRVEHRDVAGCMTGRLDDPQAEDLVAVADRGQLAWDRDARDVGRAGVTGRARGRLEDGGGTARVVAMEVGEDEMADGVPAQADRPEHPLDVTLAATDPGVDDGGLAVPDEDVGGYEAQVDPLPGHGSAGGRCWWRLVVTRGAGRGRRRPSGSGAHVRRGRRRAIVRGYTGGNAQDGDGERAAAQIGEEGAPRQAQGQVHVGRFYDRFAVLDRDRCAGRTVRPAGRQGRVPSRH